ncbi:PRC-barrel domain-containing protein [Streptomyces sp. NPDC126510]|uniref:PRC-barrel domain-containing protein n=1 Tax=Streptomyces sp. NPDC126510 TaxID=3155317 RepID=UPI0033199FDF
MFEAHDIREWRGHDVVDHERHKIGVLEAVYVDTATDRPAFATVTVGLPTRHRLVFVPLGDATVGTGYLKVAYDKKHSFPVRRLRQLRVELSTDQEGQVGEPQPDQEHHDACQ